jgi:hypothetical protein
MLQVIYKIAPHLFIFEAMLHQIRKGFISTILNHVQESTFIANEFQISRHSIVKIGIGTVSQMEAFTANKGKL